MADNNQWYSDNPDDNSQNTNTNDEPFVDYTSWGDQVNDSWRRDVYGRGGSNRAERPYQNPGKGFESISFFCGGLAMFSGISSVFGALFFAGLSITLGLLSKGKEKRSSRRLKAALIMSILGLTVGTINTTITTVNTIRTYGSLENAAKVYMKQMDEQMGFDYFGQYYDLDGVETPAPDSNLQVPAPNAPAFDFGKPESL